MPSPTNFVEPNALLALIRGDREEARSLLSNQLLGELYELDDAAQELSSLCNELIKEHRNSIGEAKEEG